MFVAAVGTFFTGAEFVVNREAMASADVQSFSPVISTWANAWHGLEALGNVWNLVLGLAGFFLSRILGSLYLINNINDDSLRQRLRRMIMVDTVPFLLLFLAFVGYLLTATGLTYDPATSQFAPESGKYLHNLLALPWVLALFLLGVVLVLTGIVRTLLSATHVRGIWFTGTGTVFTVLALLLCAGLNHTAYYPSLADPQSSLCLANSCSSEFTLSTMAAVSLIIPFVLAYIVYAWRAIDLTGITRNEMQGKGHKF